MGNLKFKIKKIPLEKKPSRFRLKYVFFVALFIWLVVGTLAIALLVKEYVESHEFRSPILFQSPAVRKEIITPVASKSAVLRVQPIYAEEKPQEEAVLHDKDSIKEVLGRETTKHFGYRHVDSMLELVFRESSFNHLAQNPTSTAYGLFQFLNQTWSNYDCEKTDNVEEQIRCGVKYIKARYGNPTKALDFHSERGWY